MPMAANTLEDRQRWFVPGQFTWPDLTGNRYCAACRFYTLTEQNRHIGRCDLVKKRHGFHAVPFEGATAIGCSQFEESK